VKVAYTEGIAESDNQTFGTGQMNQSLTCSALITPVKSMLTKIRKKTADLDAILLRSLKI